MSATSAEPTTEAAERAHDSACAGATDHEGPCPLPELVDPDDPGPQPDEPKPDAEEILPEAGPFTMKLLDGTEIPCVVKRLRAREFLALLRVLTRGFGDGIAQITLAGDDAEEMQGQIMGMMLVAIPEAVDEFVDFVAKVVEPADGSDAKRLAKSLQNPDVTVLIDVAEFIATQEKDDLAALMGKARAALARIQSLYGGKPK